MTSPRARIPRPGSGPGFFPRKSRLAPREIYAGPKKKFRRAARSPESEEGYIAIFSSFAAVLPRMSAFSASLSDVLAKMWSTGWSCQG
jgi:hypothetical protein